MVPRRLDGSGVEAGVERNGTRTEGGYTTPPVHFQPSLFVFFVLERPSRSAPAETEKTGADPHFLPLARIG